MLRQLSRRLRNRLTYGDSDFDPIQVLVFEDRQLALLVISKVACTSIKATIGKEIGIGYSSSSGLDIHLSDGWTRVIGKLPVRFRDYYLAAFVRSPFSRLVSCYQDRVLYSQPSEDLPEYYFHKYPVQIPANCSFETFLRIVGEIPDSLADRHFKQQTYSLLKAGRQPDFLGRFENLAEDWGIFARRFGFPESLERLNPSNRHKHRVVSDWRELYTPGCMKLVAERFRQDLEELGYAADLEQRRRSA